MIFQQVNLGAINQVFNQEFMNICKSHPSCENCPLKNNDMDVQGVMLRCDTGRAKENK